MKIFGICKKTVCIAAAAAAMTALSGCTSYTRMMRNEPQEYISMAYENTADAMAGGCFAKEYEILKDACSDGTMNLSFDAEGINFNGSMCVNEKDKKAAVTCTQTNKSGKSFQMCASVDIKGMKIGTVGESGEHIYSLTFENLAEKFAKSIFAPESGTDYALSQWDYEMYIEYADEISAAVLSEESSEENKYKEIIETYANEHPPVIEEKTEADIGGELAAANTITYDIPKGDIISLTEQILDIDIGSVSEEAEDRRAELEELKEELLSEIDKMDDCSLKLVYCINSKTHMLMKADFIFKSAVYNEGTGQNDETEVYLNVLFGADPENSDSSKMTAGIRGEEELCFTLDMTRSENGSSSVLLMNSGDEVKELASLSVNRDEENYTVEINAVEDVVALKIEGTVRCDKNSFRMTVDSISGNALDSEISYTPNCAADVSKGGEMPEFNAEKELLDLTEEEMDKWLDDMEADFSAVLGDSGMDDGEAV